MDAISCNDSTKTNVESYQSVEYEKTSKCREHDENLITFLGTESGRINKGPKFGKRHWQILNLCSLILITYFMRMNLSVAIVAMTDENASENKNIPIPVLGIGPFIFLATFPWETFLWKISIVSNINTMSPACVYCSFGFQTYKWSDKGVILSSFLWGYITMQVVAGWLGSQYGAKWFVVGAVGMCSLFSLLIPLSAESFGSKGVIGCRIVQGLSQGFIYPSIYYFLGQWIPPNERSLGSVVFASRAIGILIAMFGTGQIASSWYGWPMVFYFFGVLGLVWCIYFSYFGCNGPAYHSTISTEEKLYIEKSLCQRNGSDKPITPWWDIFTSVPFWAVTSVQCGTIWVFWIVQTEIPIYISKVMKVDIGSSGTLSALPPLAQWIMTYLFGFLSDYLLNKNVWSIGIARKTMNSIGLFLPAISLVLLANCGEDEPHKAVALLVLTIGANSACQSGFQLNLIDIAPNFAGVLMGASNTLAHLLAIFAPLCVQYFVKNEENPDEWKFVFYSSAAVYVVVGLLFITYGSGEVQHWNDGWKVKVMHEKRNLVVK